MHNVSFEFNHCSSLQAHDFKVCRDMHNGLDNLNEQVRALKSSLGCGLSTLNELRCIQESVEAREVRKYIYLASCSAPVIEHQSRFASRARKDLAHFG